MTERRGDRDRLDEIEQGYLDRADENRALIKHVYRVTVIAIGTVVVILLILGFLTLNLRSENSDRIDDIQQSRHDAALANCRATNERNRVAYEFLKALPPTPGQPKRSPNEQQRLVRGFTDALVGPVRDCEHFAARLTR